MDEVEFYLIDLKSRFDKIKPNTYYLSYSGGKDSHFLYWFIKEYLKRDDIKIVGINTYMEHHEILQRIQKNSDIVLKPKMKPFEIKEKYGSPCFSKIQDDFIDRYQRGSRTKSLMERIGSRKFKGKDNKIHTSSFSLNKKARELLLSNRLHRVSPKCCYYLKKKTAHDFEKETGLRAILGVRGNESAMRKTQYKSCFTKDKKFTPIHDLSDELLDKIYQKYNIEIPNVYNHIKRTGCMGCPYGHYKGDTQKELQLINDSQFKFVCEYFKESYVVEMMLSRYKVIDKLNTTQYLTIEEREELLDLLEQAEDKTIYYNLYVLLQARIDKAIEYIKDVLEYDDKEYASVIRETLLEILGGSGKE